MLEDYERILQLAPILSNSLSWAVFARAITISTKDLTLAVSNIMKALYSPPDLMFSDDPNDEIDLDFPPLRKPNKLEDIDITGHEARRPNEHLSQLNTFLTAATDKFEYGRTSKEDWNNYMRFASDDLVCHYKRKSESQRRDECRAYGIKSKPRLSGASRKSINRNQETAACWFRESYLPALINDARSVHLILGEPGAGKSTLLKYLITNYDLDARAQRVILCRFEFLKFFKDWCGKKSKNAQKKFPDYLSHIILRDVLVRFAYRRLAPDVIQLEKTTEFFRAIKSLERFSEIDPRVARDLDRLDMVLGSDGLNFKALRDLSPAFRLLLIKELSGQQQVAVIFDGLDAISWADFQAKSERSKTLIYVVDRAANGLTDVSSVFDENADVIYATTLIMRPNSLFLFESEAGNDVLQGLEYTHTVDVIRPEVALFNVTQRAVKLWCESTNSTSTKTARRIQLVYQSILYCLKALNRELGGRGSRLIIYDLFNGNIRDINSFAMKIADWFAKEAYRENIISLHQLESLDGIYRAMTSPAGLELIRSKAYQLVTVLLLDDNFWFENEIKYEQPDDLDELLGIGTMLPNAAAGNMTDNENFSGLVDNIFNYHIPNHSAKPTAHALLFKVRCLQIVSEGPISLKFLNSTLRSKFGIKLGKDAMGELTSMMIRAKFLRVIRTDNGSRLDITSRASVCLSHLTFNLSYLENVYHASLLPSSLLRDKPDGIRNTSIDRWTAQSVRNIFVLLAYIQHLEAGRAYHVENFSTGTSKLDGRSIYKVPEGYELLPNIKKLVLPRIERILKDAVQKTTEDESRYVRNWRLNRAKEHQINYVEHLIKEQINKWMLLGIIVEND